MNNETFTKEELWWMSAILDFHRNELPAGVSYWELCRKIDALTKSVTESEIG